MTKNKPEPVTAAGGVLFRLNESKDSEVLLIYRNKVWDLPKGKLENGESIAQCAVREVSEEIHCPIPAVVSILPKTYHEYKERGILWGKTTYWFSMILTREAELKPQKKEGITDVRWVPLDEALAMVGYENLRTVLSSFEESRT